MQLEPLEKDQIESIVSKAIQDAVDFIDSEIHPQRLKAQRYFDLETDLGFEEGRSSVVSSKCRDVVRGLKPSLQRVFLASEKPVEFVPRGPEDAQSAEQATSFINFKFQQLDGYKLINDVFQDAMVKKTGIAYVYYDDRVKTDIQTYTGLSDEEFTLIVDSDDVEVIEHEKVSVTKISEDGIDADATIHDLKISRSLPDGDLAVKSIPPEDFFIDRSSRSISEYYICGHTSDMTMADLLAMGFSEEDLEGVNNTEYSVTDDEAEFERRGYTVSESDDENESYSSRKITVTTAFMKLDVEGTGKQQLYQFICAGSNYTLLDFYEADETPYAIFEVDPEPHAFFGTSTVDLCISDQDAATSMLRGILDNAALVNNPGLQIVDGQVATEDVLSNEVGRIVRVKNLNAMKEMAIPFTAAQTLPALQYFDQLVDNKTGVSKMAQGLDPDVLKSATATSVAASMEGQAGQAEVIARNLAEGGMRQLFSLMLKLFVKNVDEEQVMRLNGSFVPIDPTSFNPEMDLIVNVGIGTGRQAERAAALQQTFAVQQQIYTAYGPMNGVVTLTQMRNTLADMLAMGGIRNVERYFQPMTEEIEQQMLMQQAQQAQQAQMQQGQQPDPMAMAMQAEQMKAQTNAQVQMAKAQMDNQYKMHKLGMDDDLQRDEMVQNLAVKVAEILGKYGTAVDVQGIKAEQDAAREHNDAMKQMGMNSGY
tara:strand:- start:3034 stop:5151 length:2118 start_codon:yes stop_codon:yes gene_type:complete